MNWQRFCEKEQGHYNIDKPWVKGGWKYATDGRLAIRQECEEEDTPGAHVSGIEDLFHAFDIFECRTPLPPHDGTTEEDRSNVCLHCGRGAVQRPAGMSIGGKVFAGPYVVLIHEEMRAARYVIRDRHDIGKNWIMHFVGEFNDHHIQGLLCETKPRAELTKSDG